MKKNMMKGKVQGTVLFTVVTVMMILVLFLMSTLILATAAHRRSYYTYYETQAQYAAQAALDAVTNNAYTQADFLDYIQNGGTEVTVDFSQSDLPISGDDKTVTCTVERVDENYIWDTKNGRIAVRNAYKITATASVGNGKNRAEYTIANYIYESIRDNDASTIPNNAASWTILTRLETQEERQNTETHNDGTIESMTDNGCLTLAGGATDNITGFGSSVIGAYMFPNGRTKYGESDWGVTTQFTFANDGVQTGGSLIVNGASYTGNSQYYVLEAGQGIVMMGNIYVQNGLNIYSDTGFSANVKYKDLPYMYVDGKVYASQNFNVGYTDRNMSLKTVTKADGSTENVTPTNLYAGSITCWNDSNAFYGDVYLYETTASSYIAPKSTMLVQFVNQNVTKSNYAGGYVGGDLICNNASLQLKQGTIGGDLIMTNPAGELKLEGATLTVQGAVVLAGKINITNDVRITATGGFYVLPGSTVTGGGKLFVNNVSICEGTNTWDNAKLTTACAGCKEKKADGTEVTNSATSAYIESLGVTVTGADYAATVLALKNARAKYTYSPTNGYTNYKGYADAYSNNDYSLFPFCSRLDEIFEEYIRWDVRSGSDNGFATAAEAEAYTDDLIAESKAAGHTWTSVGMKSTDYSGVRYFPCTHPLDKANNAFIGQYSTYSKTDVQNNYTYYDSFAKLTTAYATSWANHAEYGTGTDQTALAKQNVKLYGHTADGTEKSDTVSAYVVNQSCVLNIGTGGYGTSASDVIFIDPTARGYNSDKPMVVVLNGGSNYGEGAKIVINNTAKYSDLNDYETTSKVTPYYNSNPAEHASRADVIIYFPGNSDGYGIWPSKLVMLNSGMYYQYAAKNIDFVCDVLYPGETGWADLGEADKYKYELIPNDLIFMYNGSITFSNGSCLTGAIIAPTTKIDISATTENIGNKLPVTYRLTYGSEPVTQTRWLSVVGSVFSETLSLNNLPMVVYAGPVSVASDGDDENEETVTNYSTVNNSDSNTAATNSSSGGNYLDNDHQSAG